VSTLYTVQAVGGSVASAAPVGPEQNRPQGRGAQRGSHWQFLVREGAAPHFGLCGLALVASRSRRTLCALESVLWQLLQGLQLPRHILDAVDWAPLLSDLIW